MDGHRQLQDTLSDVVTFAIELRRAGAFGDDVADWRRQI